ncbi:MAG: HAD family hydrolase, partial [Thermodesulforhabdaceae bacterium]
SRGVDTFDGVVPFVKSLFDAGIPLGLVSGSFRREVEVFLNYLGILELFSIFVTAEDVKHSKPDPESYLKALDLMSDYLNKTLNPSSCFAFEDTPAGIEAAKGANIKVIGVEHSFDRKDLYKADVVIPSFKEMSLDSFMSLLKEIG